jgi:hypothetical protein
MADITMCSGEGCQIKDKYYKYTAIEGIRQSIFATPPSEQEGTCEMFWGDNANYLYSQLKEIVKEK